MAQKDSAPLFDTWSSTLSNTIKISHKWTINNFSFHCQKPLGKLIDSVTFFPEANPKLKWCLRAYPSGYDVKDYFSLYLYCKKGDDIYEVMTKYKLYFIDVDNVKKNLKEASYTFEKPETFGWPQFIEKKLLLGEKANVLLPDDKLTIACEIEILGDIINVSGKRESNQVEMSKSQMDNGFLLLFETHSLSDVTLSVNGKDIQAHKAILAARSQVFLAMFENNMQEKQSNRVEINDIDYEVVMEMLQFIYTEKAPNLEQMAKDLLVAANKYDLNGLKDLCVGALHKSLDIKNVVDILVLSYLHNADYLKDLAISFICEHTTNVIKTETFESMVGSYPKLMIEILHAMSTRDSQFNSVTAKKK